MQLEPLVSQNQCVLQIAHQVSLPRTRDLPLIHPPSIINGTAVSKTFQILYRNEEVTLPSNYLL